NKIKSYRYVDKCKSIITRCSSSSILLLAEVGKMIQSVKGNLLEDSAEAYVNTVNTVGVMGKGIALQFKQAFPNVFKQYEKDCKKGLVQVGKMHVLEVEGIATPKYVINFPTKDHWRNPSKLEYIEIGLKDLV